MKLYNVSSELKSIATVCSGNDNISASFLPYLKIEHFHYPPTQAAFERISKLAKSRGEVPSYEELIVDPVLDEDFRQVLAQSEYRRPVKIKEKQERLYNALEKYRKLRAIYYMAKETLETLKGTKVDVDDLINDAGDALAVARSFINEADDVVHVGKGNNSSALVKDILYNMDVAPLIPSGFKSFDTKNGGFPRSGVVTLCASSGGGKSIAAMQLGINFFWNKVSTRIVTLEMPRQQYMSRVLSNISGIHFTKIKQKTTSREDRLVIKRAYKKFVAFGKQHNTRFSIVAPKHDLSLDQILWAAKPYGYAAIIIDYISLLKDVNVDNQAQALAEVSRQAKIFATNNDCLIILLAQMSDEDKVKYSRAIVENSDVVWMWRYGEEQKESELIDINNYKTRDGETFHFSCKEAFKFMRMTDEGPVKNFDDEEDSEDIQDEHDHEEL